jgi:hypothetical protein
VASTVTELARLAAIALGNAQRLAFAHRDPDRRLRRAGFEARLVKAVSISALRDVIGKLTTAWSVPPLDEGALERCGDLVGQHDQLARVAVRAQVLLEHLARDAGGAGIEDRGVEAVARERGVERRLEVDADDVHGVAGGFERRAQLGERLGPRADDQHPQLRARSLAAHGSPATHADVDRVGTTRTLRTRYLDAGHGTSVV